MRFAPFATEGRGALPPNAPRRKFTSYQQGTRNMYRLTLGRSGQSVSALGLGCVGMSQAYGPADESQSMETMQCALDQGIDLFDTSDLYGVGHNEELIGRFLKKAGRGRVLLATKFGSLPAGADGLPGVDNSPVAHPEGVRCVAQAPRHRRDRPLLHASARSEGPDRRVGRRDGASRRGRQGPLPRTVGSVGGHAAAGACRPSDRRVAKRVLALVP